MRMRTTLDIDAVLLRELKRLKRSEAKTLGAVVNELLASALAARKRPRRTTRVKLRAFDMGQPLVALEDRHAIQALLDEEDFPPTR